MRCLEIAFGYLLRCVTTGNLTMSFIKRFLLSPPTCTNLEQLKEKVQGKTVLITGASFGIGEATALLLGQSGAKLLLLARTKEKLDILVEQITGMGGQAEAYVIDLYKVEALPSLMQSIQATHPQIDIIISNAGKSIRRPITASFGRDDLERCIALNVMSPSNMIMALLPRMLIQGGGQIINVSSVSVRHLPAPHWAVYQSTKTGFDVWFRSVASEVRSKNMVLSSVYLPLVRTRMIAPTKIYDRWPALSPLEAAQVIAYTIVNKKESLAPWWLGWAELFSVLFRKPLSHLLTFLYQSSK
jgi:short-subunit dehydrogenase